MDKMNVWEIGLGIKPKPRRLTGNAWARYFFSWLYVLGF